MGELTSGFQGFLNLNMTIPLPEFFQEILEKVNQRQVLIQFQQLLKSRSFLRKQVVFILQEQIFTSFDYRYPFLGSLLIFLSSHLIDNFSKSLHQMKLIKNNRRFWATFLHDFNIRVPSVHRYRFNRVFLFFAQGIKECLQSFIFSLLPYKDSLASLPVEDHGEIVMPFLDCHFIHIQKTGITCYTLSKLVLKILFMNGFNCLPI